MGKGRLRRCCECNTEVYTQGWLNHCKRFHPERNKDSISFIFVDESFGFLSNMNIKGKESSIIQEHGS
jgi:hypothetical protein